MRKVSIASFVMAIIFMVCAIVLNVLGFVYINGTQVVRHTTNGFMQMSYYTSTSLTNVSFAMIIAGGFLFIGAILMFMLSAMTRCKCHHHEGHCCRKEDPKAEPVTAEVVAEPEPETEPTDEEAPSDPQ